MIRNSVRLRLTLWNIGALALVLLAFAGVVHGMVQTMLLRSIDRDLATEAGAALAHNITRTRLVQKGSLSHGRDGVVINTFQISSFATTGHSAPEKSGEIARLLNADVNAALLPEALARHKQIIVRLEDGAGQARPSAKIPRWPVGDGYATITDSGQPLRVFSQSLRDKSGHMTGFVQSAYVLTEMHNLIQSLDWTLLLLIPPALLVAGVGGAFLTGRALRPVAQITQAAAALEASDLSRRLPVTGRDEFARLAATFNSLFGRLEAAFFRLQESVALQKRFTADASHELRTPLTTIKSHADWACRRPRQPEEYQESFAAVEAATDRMARIVDDLLLLARGDHGTHSSPPSLIAMPELFARVQRALPAYTDGPALSFTAAPPEFRVPGDIHHLERLLTNLIDNALRHTFPSGAVRVSAEERSDAGVITVEDNGDGIPAEHLPHVCERFYRVDTARTRESGGTGLGLAICQSIAEEHGGTLTIESTVGQGTRVTVTLPAVPEFKLRPAMPKPTFAG